MIDFKMWFKISRILKHTLYSESSKFLQRKWESILRIIVIVIRNYQHLINVHNWYKRVEQRQFPRFFFFTKAEWNFFEMFISFLGKRLSFHFRTTWKRGKAQPLGGTWQRNATRGRELSNFDHVPFLVYFLWIGANIGGKPRRAFAVANSI